MKPANLDDPVVRPRLPVFDPGLAPTVPGFDPIPRDPGCRRCDLGSKRRHVKNVCMAGGGAQGGTLVVLESPTQADDVAGKFVGADGVNKAVASILAPYRHAYGPFRFVWAVSCPARRRVEASQVEACRPYLAGEYAAGPKRALLFGATAVTAATGHWLDPVLLRYGWDAVAGVPSYFLPAPYQIATNKFYADRARDDVRWAFQEGYPKIDRSGLREVVVPLTPEEAVEALAALQPGHPVAYDTEYWPKDVWAKGRFTLLCVGFRQGDVIVVVPGSVAAGAKGAIRRVLANPAFPKVVANAKGDRHAIWRALEIDVRGVEWDTQVAAQLMASDERRGLSKLAWQVGLGGYKEVGQAGADDDE